MLETFTPMSPSGFVRLYYYNLDLKRSVLQNVAKLSKLELATKSNE